MHRHLSNPLVHNINLLTLFNCLIMGGHSEALIDCVISTIKQNFAML